MISREELRSAIRAKCIDCSGGARRAAAECRVKDCPLYPYRPGRGAKEQAGIARMEREQVSMFGDCRKESES